MQSPRFAARDDLYAHYRFNAIEKTTRFAPFSPVHVQTLIRCVLLLCTTTTVRTRRTKPRKSHRKTEGQPDPDDFCTPPNFIKLCRFCCVRFFGADSVLPHQTSPNVTFNVRCALEEVCSESTRTFVDDFFKPDISNLQKCRVNNTFKFV